VRLLLPNIVKATHLDAIIDMNLLDILWTLLRWKDEVWEVHPINLDDEFSGWV
jgi:hypothetical protein